MATLSTGSPPAALRRKSNSWVGPGQNQPIQPGQLGSALGQNVLNELSQRTGMSQRELLNQLATVLPQLINHLTPYGRMPTQADIKKGKGDFADLFDADRKIRIVASKSEVTEAAHKIGAWEGYLENVSTLLGGRTVLGSRIKANWTPMSCCTEACREER